MKIFGVVKLAADAIGIAFGIPVAVVIDLVLLISWIR